MVQADRPPRSDRQPVGPDQAFQVRGAALRPDRPAAGRLIAPAERLFRFAQFEFPWALGPDDGRYLVRPEPEAEPSHVVVLATEGARERRRLGRRRAKAAGPEPEPAPVPVARATVIVLDEPLASEPAAQAWLGRGREEAQEEAHRALEVLNRLLQAHRAAAADAYLREVSAEQALVARVGYGAGEQVADGRWAGALELDLQPRRPRRVAALRPQERLAALLAARDRPLACEELTLRARLDLDEGRPREAALQLRVALEAALAELEAEAARPAVSERLGELRERRGAVGEAANAALRGDLDEATVESVADTVGRLETVLRARSAGMT